MTGLYITPNRPAVFRSSPERGEPIYSDCTFYNGIHPSSTAMNLDLDYWAYAPGGAALGYRVLTIIPDVSEKQQEASASILIPRRGRGSPWLFLWRVYDISC